MTVRILHMRNFRTLHVAVAVGLASLLLLSPKIGDYFAAFADTNGVINSEGVAGYVDKKHRNPSLSVGVVNHETVAQILVDAYVPDKQYEKFPIRFDFFVNRSYVTSQIRSTTLTGPIGIEVGDSMATRPFTYSVIATLLHPNRQFVTEIDGTVEKFTAPTPSTTLVCTLSIEDADANTVEYKATGVAPTGSNGTFSVSFSGAQNDSKDLEASLSTSVTVTETAASASLKITTSDGESIVASTGTATASDTELTALSLTSSDEKTTLDCQ